MQRPPRPRSTLCAAASPDWLGEPPAILSDGNSGKRRQKKLKGRAVPPARPEASYNTLKLSNYLASPTFVCLFLAESLAERLAEFLAERHLAQLLPERHLAESNTRLAGDGQARRGVVVEGLLGGRHVVNQRLFFDTHDFNFLRGVFQSGHFDCGSFSSPRLSPTAYCKSNAH